MRSILAFVAAAALSTGALAQSDKDPAVRRPAGASSSAVMGFIPCLLKHDDARPASIH